MKIGQRLWIPGYPSFYEVVHARGASIIVRKAGGSELFWIIEDDLPLGTTIQ